MPPQTVYPRVCGGTLRRRTVRGDGAGLSPRVRGNQEADAIRCYDGRSIPACAGEPLITPRKFFVPRVYPRVCGGTVPPPVVRLLRPGLSPRVRGNPTHAPPAPRGGGVYPRVCGGTSPAKNGMTASTGLSPRVRGNPHRQYPGYQYQRSIPACAGEPR